MVHNIKSIRFRPVTDNMLVLREDPENNVPGRQLAEPVFNRVRWLLPGRLMDEHAEISGDGRFHRREH